MHVIPSRVLAIFRGTKLRELVPERHANFVYKLSCGRKDVRKSANVWSDFSQRVDTFEYIWWGTRVCKNTIFLCYGGDVACPKFYWIKLIIMIKIIFKFHDLPKSLVI